MQPKGTLDTTRVTDIEKRRTPSRYYVYVIEVHWSDGSLYKIGRRFGAIFDMHMSLLEKFPTEGGQKDPSKRIIPFLPGKNIFARNHSRDVTLKRLQSITEYCEALNALPSSISQCEILKAFFRANEDDVSHYSGARSRNTSGEATTTTQTIQITGPLEFDSYLVIADYKADDKSQVNLTAGDNVEVAEKNENGWWLVCNIYGSNGWVPGAYLEKPDGKKENLITASAERGQGDSYKATCAYEATSNDEISFPVGAELEILQKNLEGWWLACYNGAEGWVPGSYLEKSEILSKERGNSSEARDTLGGLVTFGGESSQSFRKQPRLPPKRSTIKRQVPKGTRGQSKIRSCCYITLYDFKATIDEGLSFQAGQDAEVLEQSDNGWWLVEVGGNRGWAPASYLEQRTTKHDSPNRSPPLPLRPPSPNVFGPSSGFVRASPRKVRPSSPKLVMPSSPAARSPSPLLSSPVFQDIEKRNVNGGRSSGPRPPQRPSYSPAANSPSKTFSDGNKHPAKNPLTEDISDSMSWKLQATDISKKREEETPKFGNIFSKIHKPDEEIPIDQQKWFRSVPREAAEKLLVEENKEGYFIVRPSSRKGTQNPYSLTLFHRNSIFNFHLRKRNDGLYATGVFSEGEKTFRSVTEMIEFYRSNTLIVGDSSNQVKLKGTPLSV